MSKDINDQEVMNGMSHNSLVRVQKLKIVIILVCIFLIFLIEYL